MKYTHLVQGQREWTQEALFYMTKQGTSDANQWLANALLEVGFREIGNSRYALYDSSEKTLVDITVFPSFIYITTFNQIKNTKKITYEYVPTIWATIRDTWDNKNDQTH
jgi:hypothetical protein